MKDGDIVLHYLRKPEAKNVGMEETEKSSGTERNELRHNASEA